jgi:hypothetical protein
LHTVLEVYFVAEVHLGRDGGEDQALLPPVWERELNLPVQTARPQQCGIERVGAVRRHDHLARSRTARDEEQATYHVLLTILSYESKLRAKIASHQILFFLGLHEPYLDVVIPIEAVHLIEKL